MYTRAWQHHNLFASFKNKDVEHEEYNGNELRRAPDDTDTSTILNNDMKQDDGNGVALWVMCL